ncbi:hypothetical protein EMCRGX_G026623 [Ephydatia muelleri]
MEEGQHDLTPAGNMRAPSKQLMVQWVVSAWEAVTTETIVRSFEACELSQVTGTDDSDSDDDQWSSCDEEDDEVDHGDMDGSQDEVDVE